MSLCIHFLVFLKGWTKELLKSCSPLTKYSRTDEALCQKQFLIDNTCYVYVLREVKERRTNGWKRLTIFCRHFHTDYTFVFSFLSNRFYRFSNTRCTTQWTIKIIVGYYKTNSYIYMIRSDGKRGKFIESGITRHGDTIHNKMYWHCSKSEWYLKKEKRKVAEEKPFDNVLTFTQVYRRCFSREMVLKREGNRNIRKIKW